jgi:hypothetical protein
MAYDEGLADRVRDLLLARSDMVERQMFGGLAWMVGGNMACCALGEGLLVRVPPGEVEEACRDAHVDRFGMPGRRPMSGFVAVAPEALAGDAALAAWVDRGTARAASLPPK